MKGRERKESSSFSPPLVARAFSRGSLRLPLKWRASSKASGTRDVDPHGRLWCEQVKIKDKGAARLEDYSVSIINS